MKSFFWLLLFLFGTVSSFSQVKNQNEILFSFSSGKYTVYKVEKISYKKYKMVAVKKQWPIVFTKSENEVTELVVKRAGILDEQFIPDVPGYPAYFAFGQYRLSFIENIGIYYSWNGKEQATTKYVFVKAGTSLKYKYEELNTKVAAYAKAVFKKQSNARTQVKQKKAALAEADRIANSLQNKQVSKIAVLLINKPSKIAHFSPAIKYGIEATLKDGSKLSTSNLGGKLPWSDFKLNHKGCSNTIDEVRVDEDAKTLNEDRLLLQIEAIYHPTLKAKKTLNTTYNVSIKVNQNGFWGHNRHKFMTVTQGLDGQHAGRGDNLTVKVKTVKHNQTGIKINKFEIYNETQKKLVARYKLTPETELIINAMGGKGMNGFEGTSGSPNGGNGGNGGAGGNVTVIKDPSVMKCTLTINNKGGRGGNGGKPKYINAARGRNGITGDNGTLKTVKKAVILNF